MDDQNAMHRLKARATATPARRRTLWAVITLFCLWVTLSLFAWLAGPRLLTDWATGYVQDEFGHRLTIAELEVHPLALAITVRGLALDDDLGRDLVSFREMVVDVDATSVVRAMVILDEFRLDGLMVNVERLDADHFNFSNLADRLAQRFAAKQVAGEAPSVPEKGGAAIYFLVRHTEINDAALRFADHTRHPLYETRVQPLNLRMDDLTSRPDREAPYNFTASLGPGGTLSWQGDLSLEPLRSKGTVTLAGLGLSAAYDYVRESFGFALPAGTLDVRVDYFADFSGTQSILRIDDGRFEVKGLETTGIDGEPLFAFDSTLVSGVQADIMKSTARVARIETRGGRVHFTREATGNNLARALVPRVPATPDAAATPVAAAKAAPAAVAARAAPAPTAWRVDIQSLAVLGYTLDFADRVPEPDVRVQLANVDFEATGIQLPALPAIPFTLAGNVVPEQGDAGAFAMKGTYTLDGGALNADVRVDRLPLAVASPYLADMGRFTLLSGTADWQGHVTAAGDFTRSITATGSGRLANVAVRDDVRKTRLASVGELAIDGLAYDDRVPKTTLRRITLAGLELDFSRNRAGISNLQEVFAPKPGTATGAAKPVAESRRPAAASKPMVVRLDSFVVRDTTVNFRDASPDLSFTAQLSKFGGRIDGLSTDPAQRATVTLDGVVNRYAPLSISGAINPLAAQTYSDLRIRLSSLDLSALTPYTVTYIAYPLARGKLALELDWKIADRRFDSQNRALIDGLALGEKRPAPRATKLPVKLGLALLTDREGDADLRVPAYGDLDDPKFRIGGVIFSAIGNLLTRAATAPFAALGGLGGDTKPDVVVFPPGESALPDTEQAKLARIASAIAERPMLAMTITGTASPTLDRAALKEAELEMRIKREYLDSPFRRGMTVDQVSLSPEKRADVLAALYRKATGNSAGDLRDAQGQRLSDADRHALAEKTLLDGISVDDGALRQLARERAQRVKDQFLAAGVGESRLVVSDGEVQASAGTAADGVPARLTLEAP